MVSDRISTAPADGMFAAVIAFASAWMSVRALAGDGPAVVIGVTPLVTEPGETPATAALVGSINSVSRNAAIPATMSRRMTSSADGVDVRASSSVMTMIPAHFRIERVIVPNCSFPTGLGAPWPTH